MDFSKITQQSLENYLRSRGWSELVRTDAGFLLTTSWSAEDRFLRITFRGANDLSRELVDAENILLQLAKMSDISIEALYSELMGYRKKQPLASLEAQIPHTGLVSVGLTLSLPPDKAEFLRGVSGRSRFIADFLLTHWDELKASAPQPLDSVKSAD